MLSGSLQKASKSVQNQAKDAYGKNWFRSTLQESEDNSNNATCSSARSLLLYKGIIIFNWASSSSLPVLQRVSGCLRLVPGPSPKSEGGMGQLQGSLSVGTQCFSISSACYTSAGSTPMITRKLLH